MKPNLLILLSLALACNVDAGSATWNLNPTSGDWNTAVNWTPHNVPNGPTDVATFAASSITDLTFSAEMTEVAAIIFDPGVSSFNITADASRGQDHFTLSISGPGITNNSGVTQNLTSGPTVRGDGGTIEFLNAATAGDGTALTALGSATDGAFSGSEINFYDTSTAGTASIVAEGALGRDDAGGGEIVFFDNATAANASFIASGAVAPGGSGGEISFTDDSTAANAIFNLEDGTNGGFGGEVTFSGNSTAATAQFTVVGGDVTFFNNSTAANATFDIEDGGVVFSAFDENKPTAANGLFTISGGSTSGAAGGSIAFSGGTGGNATLIANSGTNGGAGAKINFFADDQSEARIQLFGNATLTVFFHTGQGVGVGSIEGDGLIVLSTNQKLIIGSNELSTTFSGTIQDFGSGSLEKIGTGTLSLRGASSYAGGTTVSFGVLKINNQTGSGTGTGAVTVRAGTLAGHGIIAGSVTVGTGTGPGAFLSPSRGARHPGSLALQSSLTFRADSTYEYKLNTRRARADQVIVNRVTIESGAQFNLYTFANKKLTAGKVLTAISNTAATPIAGTFGNLPDGGTISAGSNTFQADYEGGDGNDLTLTVVP